MARTRTATRRSILAAAFAAVVGVDVVWSQRKERYLDLARRHRSQAAPLDAQSEPAATIRRRHLDLARRYERAAYRPWLRVGP